MQTYGGRMLWFEYELDHQPTVKSLQTATNLFFSFRYAFGCIYLSSNIYINTSSLSLPPVPCVPCTLQIGIYCKVFLLSSSQIQYHRSVMFGSMHPKSFFEMKCSDVFFGVPTFLQSVYVFISYISQMEL